MRFVISLLDRLVRAMNLLATIAAVLMAVFVCLSSMMRYLVGAPFHFSDELVGLLFMAMAFLAIPLLQMRRRHISVDILTHIMPPKLQKLAELTATLILIAFGAAFIAVSYQYTAFSKLLDSHSEMGDLLLWPWMALMPVCTLILTLVALAQLYDTGRMLLGRPPLIDHPAE
jgi:TRAP-type C4-dicarboxylate transport system permease small subunit